MRNASLFVLLGLVIGIAPLRADEPPKPTVLKAHWQRKLPPYEHYDSIDKDRYEEAYKWCREAIAAARKAQSDRKQPAFGDYAPLVAGNLVVAQTPVGPCAYALEGDASQKPPAKAGEIMWASECDRGLAVLGRDPGRRAAFDRVWMNDTTARTAHVLGNSLIGRAAASGQTIFYIDDFGAYPPVMGKEVPKVVGPFSEGLDSNTLCGVDLESGKLIACVGSRLALKKDPKGLNTSIFLGPPLVAGERIYVINEKDKQLRLLALDPKFPFHFPKDQKEEKGILATVPLVTALESAEKDTVRRMQALQIVATEKYFLCPTHAGAIVAVDRKEHKLTWTARYRKEEEKRAEARPSDWKATPPVVDGDFIAYMPPDFLTIEVFKLADGTSAWRRERNSAIYLAGAHDGKAIVVETDSIRALNLKDGMEAWKTTLGAVPTGYGAWKDDKYYLPVGEEVRVFDAKEGKLTSVLKAKEPFGNLLIHKGKLVSQTFEKLSVYELP